MREQIAKLFDSAIAIIFKENRDMQNFFLRHPNKTVCLDRLCDEIMKAERYVLKFNVLKYNLLIAETAKFFCGTALKVRDRELMTESQLRAEQVENDRIKEAQHHIHDLEKEALTKPDLGRLHDERKRREDKTGTGAADFIPEEILRRVDQASE